MKFAFLIFKYFPYGGVQRDMLRIARDCAAKGHQVTIYTGRWRGDPPGENIEVVLLRSFGVFNHQRHKSLIKAMFKKLDKDPVDLVVGFNRMPGLDAYYAADPCFVEKARNDRGWWYRLTGRYRFFANSEKAVMRRQGACRILLLTPGEKSVYQKWYGTPESRFYTLPPSIPFDTFANLDHIKAREKICREFDLPEQANIVLLVGSAFIRKGLDRAIYGLSSLQGPLKRNTWLIAVGEDKPEPMLALAKQLEISSRVIIAGARADVHELMAGADLLVHPARSELAGIVLIEALTVGLPVLVTDVCGYATHVQASGAGKVLPSPFKQAGFDKALAEMLASPLFNLWRESAKRYTANIAATTSSTVEADLLESFVRDKQADRVL